MNSYRKFIIYGPSETLMRIAELITQETKPMHAYRYNPNGHDSVQVNIYEEHNKLLNSSTTINLILETSEMSVKVILYVTGGRTGFRGSMVGIEPNEPQIQETIYEFLVDFSNRHGLSIQEHKVVEPEEKK
jgi:hypothetical protein